MVTGPDLGFNAERPVSFLFDLNNLTDHLRVGKAGLALDISDEDEMRQESLTIGTETKHIWEHESRLRTAHLGNLPNGDPAHRAAIDTTFALYKRHFRRGTFLDGVRAGGAFTCKHRPWYRSVPTPPEERKHHGRTHTRRQKC